MTRPQIIRADTIDLQDPEAPSAKDHSRQPTHPAPLGEGPPAPHQATSLRVASIEGLEYHSRSPRVSQDLSGKELQLLHEDPSASEDDEADGGHQRNGDNSLDGDHGENDRDDGLDDDMMDKISSSPSIDDGGYTLPPTWSPREDSLPSTPAKSQAARIHFEDSETFSSSPFFATPAHLPFHFVRLEPDQRSPTFHHQGGYFQEQPNSHGFSNDYEDEALDQITPLVSEQRISSLWDEHKRMPPFGHNLGRTSHLHEEDIDADNLHLLLLPADDSLLDNSFDNAPLSPTLSESSSWSSPEDGEPPNQYDDETTGDFSFADESRFVDSGWGGECLRETEDIDFEFVYALHNFVATVEGQANAAKGDTMVLLDDSNSYWWLVRVVKDSSIGYLPAEHIETPTERLARLNKHRNIDLSQTMLGDNPEKSKNPLKKAMRRRNAKTVQFAAPTYYEASDGYYSTDEEGEEEPFADGVKGNEIHHEEAAIEHDQDATVEPLRPRAQQSEQNKEDEIQPDTSPRQGNSETFDDEKTRLSEDTLVNRQDDDVSSRSRKGTVRDTDSFYKDDTVETRKMSLTPSLLRDENSTQSTITPAPIDPREAKGRGSLDAFEKAVAATEKTKEEKRKEKKPGMLSGLFKRKDRKSKSQVDEDDSEWLSKEIAKDAPKTKASSENLAQDAQSPPTSPQRNQPQRQTSKLQKPPPGKQGPTSKRPPSREGSMSERQKTPEPGASSLPPPNRSAPTPVDPDPYVLEEAERANHANQIPGTTVSREITQLSGPPPDYNQPSTSTEPKSASIFSPIQDALRPALSNTEPKLEKAKRAKERVPMDDFDSSPESENTNPFQSPEDHSVFAENHSEEQSTRERLSESPVQVSPVGALHPIHHPPPLVGDSSSQEERSASPESPSSTPELIEAPREEGGRDGESVASTTQLSSNAPTWSDASLRTYLEDDTDIRDLLIVVHDKSDVKPAGPDHPIVANLCREENRRLGEMSTRLDGLLQDWLARKSSNAAR
ncbi:MAG: hypothetical protein MMC33_005200 [Icmadophila ericetorum]|nr:hypothetical protein [Icmadophila ericetorum]